MTAGVEPAGLADEPEEHRLVASDTVFDGAVWNLRRDTIEYGARRITREFVDHPGAVAILALDDDDRVMLIKQYRHPIAARDWELPAGLLDIQGETPLLAAQRELAEETDLQATRWELLTEFFTSPGGSNETIRVFLARGLSATDEAFARFDEEADLETRWVALDDIVSAVLDRSITNSVLALSALAADAARARNWVTLGDPAAEWTWHPSLRSRS